MKRVLLFLFIFLIPINVFALEISDITISGPSEMKQGEYNTINVDVKFENIPNATIFMGAEIEIFYDNLMLTIEEMIAENSEVYYEGSAGHRDVAGILTFDKDDMSFETECTNGAFCKTYRFTFKVYPRVAGMIDFKILSAGGIFYDMSNLPEFKEEDIKEIEIEKEVTKQINIIATTNPIVVPTEPVETTQKVTLPISEISKIPIITTKATTTTPTTTLTTEAPLSTESNTSKDSKTEEEENLKKEKEHVAKINKKIFFYSGIIILVIILIIIINIIINIIKNKKIDKALKNL